MPKCVELEVHTGLNLITKQTQSFEQYLVFLVEDDVRTSVGLIGFKPGSKLIFTKVVDPINRKFVEEQVSSLLEDSEMTSKMVADIPLDVVENRPEISYDELDEEGLT